MCVLQLEADYRASKIPFTEIWWIGLYIFEKICPITSDWYAKLEQARPKCLNAWDYANSHPDNSCSMSKTRHKPGNATLQ